MENRTVANKRIWVLLVVAGFFLSILGLFLPWGEKEAIPNVMASAGLVFGIDLVMGWFALIGCIITAASSFFFRIRNKWYWCVLMLLGGLITLVSSLVWIIRPGVLAPSGWYTYRVLFGAYVTLTGSVLTSTTAILNFKHKAKG